MLMSQFPPGVAYSWIKLFDICHPTQNYAAQEEKVCKNKEKTSNLLLCSYASRCFSWMSLTVESKFVTDLHPPPTCSPWDQGYFDGIS